MNIILQSLKDFIGLIYPKLCICCRKENPAKDQVFCVECFASMPFTDHFDDMPNDFTRHTEGRIMLESGGALLHLYKGSNVQKMLHMMKYNNRPIIGRKLGELLGFKIMKSNHFDIPDMIIPVPLHKKKKKIRGYNQSTLIAEGISTVIGVEVREDILLKTKDTISQTTKGRMERLTSLEGTLSTNTSIDIEGKHVMLVDDIMTTGATLEACTHELLQISNLRVSMVTVALAR